MDGELLIDQITPMVITFNEEPNLKRCLDKLTWAKRILVIDSGSTDATLDIARSYPQVDVIHRAFDSFAQQCNFGLTQVTTPWVLSMDCDYELSDELVAELKALRESKITAYNAAFIYRMYGRPLRGTLYPPRAVLYRVDGAAYRDEGHGHRIVVTGPKGHLSAKIFHDDRKPLSRWLGSQQRYAKQEVDYLQSTPRADLGRADKLRLMGWPMPIIVFFYALVWKGCLFDGWAGWLYTLQRVAAETLIALEVVDRKVRDSV